MYSVFIIDDEPWSREVVKALVDWESLGFVLSGEAEDGTAGLRELGVRRPDIVVTDMRMPGIDGVDLLQAMHKRHPAMKIIVMSGYGDILYLKGAIRSRAVEYLLKPINGEELNAALGRCREELDTMNSLNNRINQDKQVLPRSPIFSSGEAMARYSGFRDRIYASLLALDRNRVEASFGALARALGDKDFSVKEDEGLPRIASDLLLLLEQFLSEQETTLEQLLQGKSDKAVNLKSGDGAGDVVTAMGELYRRAIDGLLTLRLSRSRLELEDVVGYIDAHFHEAISLETVAGQFLVSREHLSRLFKARTGENLSDYILRKRMEKARFLIAEERLPIKHAAQLAGYEDIAYFYRVFKKHFGVTPGELRK
ncbi:response regulator transcription factor [Paenibacillus sp. CAU 1782]